MDSPAYLSPVATLNNIAVSILVTVFSKYHHNQLYWSPKPKKKTLKNDLRRTMAPIIIKIICAGAPHRISAHFATARRQ